MKKYYREEDTDFRFSQYPLTGFPAHLHSELELMYIQQGSIMAYRDGEGYFLTQGSLFLISPNQVHSFHNSTDCQCLTLIVNPAKLHPYGDILAGSTPLLPVCRIEKKDSLYRLLDMAFTEYRTQRDMDIILSLLSAMFGLLIRTLEFSQEGYSSKKSLNVILQYCAQHYREELSVERLSKELFLSRSHISHTFSSKLKVSFTEYVNSLRLSEALRLLDGSHYTISQVATLAGFPTVRTFNRVFQKRYGCTPTLYKNKK